jgi:hypothetical protein
MTDDITSPQTVPPANTKHNIFDQTLGDILISNPNAQQMIMKSMGISQEKFQSMLSSAQQNNLMHMKIGDLFKNGIVQQAVQQYPAEGGKVSQMNAEQIPLAVSDPVQIIQQQQVQVTPEQMQQLQNGILFPQQLLQQAQPIQQKTSILEKVKSLFK